MSAHGSNFGLTRSSPVGRLVQTVLATQGILASAPVSYDNTS